MRLRTLALLWLVLATISYAQTSAQPTARPATAATGSAARLPVTRVILYKNGVGYFEHSGRIRGNQDVNIDFTTAQLNDVLKSLTVLDLGKGRITSVSYNSTAPLERRLGSLRLPVGENPTTVQFLDALRGARLEVRSGSANVSGRLLSIDQRELPAKDDQKITVNQLSIVTDNGEVRVFDLNPATSVRLEEKDVSEQVGKYLGMVASTRDQDIRRMAISTAGDGDRGLLVNYISEVPVWKCTYRIVVPKEGKPLLQGWAIVDNTVGEDWKNVELSLVAGAPQSFVQELSQPYYTRRPVVPLPENAMVTPQTHEATMEESEVVNGELRSPTIIPNGSMYFTQGGGMIRALPKPLPRILPLPKPERLPKGKTPVTLIAGLRCADGSVLLCADRERSDQSSKRSIDKIFRIVTNQGTFLIAGAGRGSIVDNALMRLDIELKAAGANPSIVLFNTHKDVIETVLYEIHEEYIWGHRDENNRAIQFIVTAAFRAPHSIPFLYGTDEEIVFPQQLYGCAGCGQDLAYYFIDKLYNDHLSREIAVLIAAFVFREVSHSVSGVGLGTDIQLLAGKDQGWYRMSFKEALQLEEIIPSIVDAIAESWSSKIVIPEWLIKFCT